jgi:hypothetical protein
MANSIRTPKQGTNATSRRIAQAVDNEEWQKFRLSLKGKSTPQKLAMLDKYYDENRNAVEQHPNDVFIRVDNYLKALARGGQIAPSDRYVDELILGTLTVRK